MVSRLTIKSILTNYAIRCNSGIRGVGWREKEEWSGSPSPPLSGYENVFMPSSKKC